MVTLDYLLTLWDSSSIIVFMSKEDKTREYRNGEK